MFCEDQGGLNVEEIVFIFTVMGAEAGVLWTLFNVKHNLNKSFEKLTNVFAVLDENFKNLEKARLEEIRRNDMYSVASIHNKVRDISLSLNGVAEKERRHYKAIIDALVTNGIITEESIADYTFKTQDRDSSRNLETQLGDSGFTNPDMNINRNNEV
ncbi:MAG: hypothetical protein AAGJ08_00260 [Cyanobacteria bacterium P01_H01_bin.35]